MAALMNQHTTPKTFARAKIFDLLLDNDIEETAHKPPAYVEASVADQMIQRAMSSFSAPALTPEMSAQPYGTAATATGGKTLPTDMSSLFQSRTTD